MSQSFSYPSLMYPSVIAPTNSKTNVKTSSLDVAVLQDNEEDGYNNAGLEIYNEFVGVANRELINRELVNLENANVNIDNSSDVIIGPVTQFNVNGNVTIYQGKDGQPVGIDENTEIPNGSCKDQSSRPQKEEQDVRFSTKRKYTFKFYLGAILLLFLLTGITVMLFFLLRKDTQEQVYESPKDTINIGDHQLIPKEIWNGKIVSDMTPMNPPVDLVIIKHTAGGTCEDFESCAKKMRSLQSSDISINKLKDVYFNFAVGGDGNVYVGRDWNVQPASGKDNIDLVLIGNFALDPFTPTMINATKAFLEFGLDRNMLTKNYRLINHNQTIATMSPGINVIVEVQKWSHYDGRNYLGKPLSGASQKQLSKSTNST